MNIRLVVPRRADDGHRDRVWDFCKRYWSEQRPGWNLVEGDHDDGPFNRSAAINLAAEGDWDVAVILDADTIVDIEPIERAIKVAHETGRLVLPFDVRCMLSKSGTDQILNSRKGSWEPFVQARQTPSDAYEYISGCQVIPRRLWDEIGGFDDRFEGWGGEDDAFHAATVALTCHDAREDRFKGKAWHLWHRPSPHANTKTATWKQARALSDRYIAATWDREAMQRLLAEDRSADQTVVSILTCPGRDTLGEAVASIDEHLSGPIGRKIICTDAEEPDFDPFPGWETIAMGRPQGYVKATRSCQYHEVASGQPFVLHSEDDFVLNGPVDIGEMQAIMGAHPELAQLSLKRQPWYPEELEAGDMLTWRPKGTFTEHERHVSHRAYWTTNTMLVRRSFLAAHEWPDQPGSERRFGQQIFRKPGLCGGVLGKLEDEPRVTHIGHVRAGHGY